jgi:hypothetical protein
VASFKQELINQRSHTTPQRNEATKACEKFHEYEMQSPDESRLDKSAVSWFLMCLLGCVELPAGKTMP